MHTTTDSYQDNVVLFSDPKRKWLNYQNERMRQGPVNVIQNLLYNYVIVITEEAGYMMVCREKLEQMFFSFINI